MTEQERAAVYYTALLINVGCHTDAHEQAKWFGDDIALKSGKYDHELRSLRGALSGLRLLGAGHPPLHRFRVGLEFALSGHREVDAMISHHADMSRARSREELELPRRRARRAAARPTSSGTGRAGRATLRARRSRSRRGIAQLAEFVEVAHRVGGRRGGPASSPRARPGGSSIPRWPTLLRARRRRDLSPGWTRSATWDAVIDAEPALALVLSGERFDAALLAIANFVDLKSPYALGHARAVAELAARRGERLGLPGGRGAHAAPRGARPRPRAARRLQRDLGQAGAAGRRASGSACACSPT